MVWVRLDDEITEHPKIAATGPLGLALFVAGLAYCNRNLTDGFIPWTTAQGLLAWQFLEATEDGRQKVMRIGVSCGMAGDDVECSYVIGLLLRAGLWEDAPGGYQIHDYDQYQPTRKQLEDDKNARIEQAKKAAKARWKPKQNAGGDAASNAHGMPEESSSDAETMPRTRTREASSSLTGAIDASAGAPASKDAAPERGAHFIDPTTVCEKCGATRGEGCQEDCPNMHKPSVTLVVDHDLERVAPPPEFAAVMGKTT